MKKRAPAARLGLLPLGKRRVAGEVEGGLEAGIAQQGPGL